MFDTIKPWLADEHAYWKSDDEKRAVRQPVQLRPMILLALAALAVGLVAAFIMFHATSSFLDGVFESSFERKSEVLRGLPVE
jgi:hypothetical protein